MTVRDSDVLSPADRGKGAEHQVQKILGVLAQRIDTAYYRLPDARSGSKAPTLSDYLLVHKGTMFLLEVKETAAKNTLPFKNFKEDQVARMRRFQMAGAISQVLIHHSYDRVWRVAPVDFFLHRAEGAASWNLSRFPTQDLLDIISPAKTFTELLALPKQ